MNVFKIITENLDYKQIPDFHQIVSDRLHRLIKVTCDIELDSFPGEEHLYFKYINDNFSISRLVYDFYYNGKKGVAYLQVDHKKEMAIVFKFNDSVFPQTILMGRNTVTVFVSNELEFVSALFEKRINFGWNSSDNSQSANRLCRSSVFIFKKMDLARKIETSILSFSGGVSKALNLGDDSSLYLSEDVDFYKTFFTVMSYCEDHHHFFESVFTDYPTRLDLSLNKDNAISDFIHQFEADYRNNLADLKDRLLLLDMQLI